MVAQQPQEACLGLDLIDEDSGKAVISNWMAERRGRQHKAFSQAGKT